MRKIILIFILLSSFALFADKPKLAVMNFVDETDGKLTKDLVRNGSKLIRSRFTRNAKKFYDVVTNKENEAALAAMKKESQRSDRDREFQIELGKQVSAAKIVISTIGTLDDQTFLITSTLIDIKRGIDENSADAVFDGTAKGLIEAVDSLIEQLLENSGKIADEALMQEKQKLAEERAAAERAIEKEKLNLEKEKLEVEMAKIEAQARKAVTDSRRSGSVEWSSVPVHNKTWKDAVQYCRSLNEGGHSDWRLPTIDEMRSIVVNCPATQPYGMCKISDSTGALTKAYYTKACNGCKKGRTRLNGHGWFWTSSEMLETDHYWVLSFKTSKISHQNLNKQANVYCVR